MKSNSCASDNPRSSFFSAFTNSWYSTVPSSLSGMFMATSLLF